MQQRVDRNGLLSLQLDTARKVLLLHAFDAKRLPHHYVHGHLMGTYYLEIVIHMVMVTFILVPHTNLFYGRGSPGSGFPGLSIHPT